jgi:hypothetical protein
MNSLPNFRDWDNPQRKDPYGWDYGHGKNRKRVSFKTKAEKKDYRKGYIDRFYSNRDAVVRFDRQEWNEYLFWKEKLKGKGTFAEAIEYYLNNHETSQLPLLSTLLENRIEDLQRKSSDEAYRVKHNASKFIAFAGDLRVDQYDRVMVQKWIDSLVKAGMSIDTIKGYRKSVKKLFTDAASDGLIQLNPASRITLPSDRGEKRLILIDPDDLQRLLDYAWNDDPGFAGLLAILFFTGMRISMIAVPPRKMKSGEFLRRDMIDLENKTIVIPEGITKTGAPLVIDDAPECMWSWMTKISESSFGMPQNTFNKRKQDYCQALNIEWHPNLHRRSFGSYLAALRGRDYASNIMGDYSRSVFVKHYQVSTFRALAVNYTSIKCKNKLFSVEVGDMGR